MRTPGRRMPPWTLVRSLLRVLFYRLVVRVRPSRARGFADRQPDLGVRRRNRLHEPLVVDLRHLARLNLRLEAVVDRLLKRGIVLTEHDGYRLDREHLRKDLVLGRFA